MDQTLVAGFQPSIDTPFSVKSQLKTLIGSYSLHQVNDAFQEICREEYDYLSTMFSENADSSTKLSRNLGVPKKSVKIHTPSANIPNDVKEVSGSILSPHDNVTDVKGIVASVLPTKIRSDTKVNILKLAEAEEEHGTPLTLLAEEPMEEVAEPNPKSAPKDPKRWQKEEELKKYKELREKGIVPSTLLTKENLKKWIEDEKKTFAAVARECVGVSEIRVSSASKKFGIRSTISTLRATKN